jgi:hypothetical protein
MLLAERQDFIAGADGVAQGHQQKQEREMPALIAA